MSRKQVDPRIATLIRNGVQEKKRSFFVVVGDRSKDVIVNLHYIMSSMDVRQNKSVLWAYKKKLLGFTSHRKKRENKIKKEIKRGVREPNENDPFELFVSLHDIRYTYYKETDKILGNTYGMCILQDFEALTPNILARTIETVAGGGLVVLLLKGMTSLKQLYTMTMDVHSRYRTEAHSDVVPRFNERFILSLGKCESCLVIDDELNVLPISGGKAVEALPPPDEDDEDDASKTESQRELEALKASLQDTPPVGALVPLARTLDQAKALLTFVEAIAEKTLHGTVALTAARGRGKSAAMGVAVAAAVAHGYANIFITSPSPENLKTFFEFVFRGFDALGYQEHLDYHITQSTNPDLAKTVLRVNVHRQHRQTIQYIRPQDAHVLGQAELLIIDEAAAIPLPVVRKLMGPYLVFMASTINGYEGTGRSLSLKLIKQLREQSRGISSSSNNGTVIADRTTGKAAKHQDVSDIAGLKSRTLREITLSEPIRYAQGDGVEKWLNSVLCLDATLPRAKKGSSGGFPDPSQCELLHVNRDTLFSYHPVSERFLQQMVSLYVASHYKNTPDDLQLMSDAPAHELFVLVGPVAENSSQLPEPLCVVQVSLEGRISRESVLNSLHRGVRPAGDMIPWVVSQQFQDDEFPYLSGARVVRIATNPDYVKMGYGARTLQLLCDYYAGKFTSLAEGDNAASAEEPSMRRVSDDELAKANLLEDDIHVRDSSSMPPLFARLSERRPPALDYVGVSYGLTTDLLRFWKRAEFVPVYLRQTANDLTGEHTCVMLKPLEVTTAASSDSSWLHLYSYDFHKRFLSLLSYQFRDFSTLMALSINEAAVGKDFGKRRVVEEAEDEEDKDAADGDSSKKDDPTQPKDLTHAELKAFLSPYDLRRLESYSQNRLDYHMILDLVPKMASLYFDGRLGGNPQAPTSSGSGTDGNAKRADLRVQLTGVQQAILLGIGLQHKDMEAVSADLNLAVSVLMGMLLKIAVKLAAYFGAIVTAAVDTQLGNDPKYDIGVSAADASAAHNDKVNRLFEPLAQTIDREFKEYVSDDGDNGDEEERAAKKQLRKRQREMIDALPLDEFEIEGGYEWDEAEKQVAAGRSTVVSVKGSGKKRKTTAEESEATQHGSEEKRKKKKKTKQRH